MEGTYITQSAGETIELAKKLASQLKGGMTLCLSGDLAAGKTTFTQGLGQYFGIGRMTSPTYVIATEYPVETTNSHIRTICHVDLYRLKSYSEARSIDLTEIWSEPTNLTIIEWPERLGDHLPENRYQITFKIVGSTTREITIKLI